MTERDRILAFADRVEQVEFPDVKSLGDYPILTEAANRLSKLAADIRDAVK